jgi:hypothetical protein
MVALVTLEQVKEALHVDTDDDDGPLGLYIEAASAAVINYLKGQAEALLDLDSSGEIPSGVEVPAPIAVATIALVGHYYREPDGDEQKAFERGYLPAPVTALLYPLRDPALA